MVVRRIIRTPKTKTNKIVHGGDLRPVGILNVQRSKIDEISPLKIPDIVLWIKAVPEATVTSTIKSYIETQLNQEALLEQFKDRLDVSVITEIKSDIDEPANSLVRFELHGKSLGFPTLAKNWKGEDVISMEFHGKSFKLCTKNPVELEQNFSMWSISKHIDIEYNRTLSKLIVDIDHVAYLKEPVAEFSEIIVFSRKLNLNETQQMEAYIANKKNELFMLPYNHPYLPDMSYLPVLMEPIRIIQTILDDTKTNLSEFNTALEANRALYGHNELYDKENTYRGQLTDILMQLSILKQMFYKGALLCKARGSITIELIYEGIRELGLVPVESTANEYIDSRIQEFQGIYDEISKYIEAIKGLVVIGHESSGQKGGALSEPQNASSAHTQDILQETTREIKAREFYQSQRTRTNKINDLGKSLYAPMNKKLNDQISVILDFLTYSNKTTNTEMINMLADFKLIDEQIATNKWLEYLPSIDKTAVDIIERQDNPLYSIKYRNTFLNTIQKLYERVRNQLEEGDMAFISFATNHKTSEIEKIFQAIQKNSIKPIWNKTFLPHCRQRYHEVDTYMQLSKTLIPVIKEGLRVLKLVLDWCSENKTAPNLDTVPVIPCQSSFRLECEDVYIRKVNKSDSNLTGIEYIVTDIQGTILQEPNQSGELDVSYIFPSFEMLQYSKEDSAFILYYPYKDETGTKVKQEFNVVDAFPADTSSIDSLSDIRRPNYWFHSAKSFYEIGRDQENGIHQFTASTIEYPIQLPKYALEVGAYFLIQNVGTVPIQVQIPGFPNDFIDMLGPQDGAIYIYSDFKEDSGGSYYGRVYLRNGYIPYDTLVNCPRSQMSVFVIELNTEIYVNDASEPLYDTDGYFVECSTDENGYTYDIDDVYLANPYRVKSNGKLNLLDLKVEKSGTLPSSSDNSILVAEDPATGLPVLCNSKGIPGLNEFGFAKFATTPLTYIDGEIHLRGSKGDIVLKASPALLEKVGVMEPFITFESVYRSSFVQSYSSNEGTSYMFSTYSKYPIVNSKILAIKANAIEIESDEIRYIDGTALNAYILNSKPYQSVKAIEVPYKNVGEVNTQIEFKKACLIVLNRYDTNKSYIIGCVDVINSIYSDVREFGQTQAQDIVTALNEVHTKLNEHLTKYNTYTQTVQGVRNGLPQGVPGDIKISIDMLDLKMREIIVSCWEDFNSIYDSIEFFSKLVTDLKKLDGTVANLRNVTVVEIEKRIGEVQAAIQSDSQSKKVTSSPDIDRLLKLMIQYKLDFLQKLSTLEVDIKKRPQYSTQFSQWIQQRRLQIKYLSSLNTKIKNIVANELPDAFDMRELLQQQQGIRNLRELQQQSDSYTKYSQNIEAWLEMNGNTQNSNSGPVINTEGPVIKGISIDLIVFDELTNPCVSRDWVSSDSARIQSELLDPIEDVKNKNKDLLKEIQSDLDLPDMNTFRTMKSGQMNTILSNSMNTLQKTLQKIMNFETDLSPILKSYESIRSELRDTLKDKLLTSVKAIHTRWITITGKRTALLTLYGNSSDINTKVDAIITADVESKVQDVLKGNTDPSYYDTMAFYALKAELVKHNEVNSQLDSIDVGLKTI